MIKSIIFSRDISRAIDISFPIVALESTVITHGLPRPHNLKLAQDMERAIREEGATPATVAFLDGQLHIGLNGAELERLANEGEALKAGPRDFATLAVKGGSGGTTVAGTMFACKHTGIKVFATGGIGGVHRETHNDISADLQALATIPMIVVCAGAKAILDLPATLEYLETTGVPVIGYGTDEFPAFYSRESGLEVSAQLDTPEEIVRFAKAHWGAGLQSAVLVANPVPMGDAIPKSEMEPLIQKASKEAVEKEIHGKKITPFLLDQINKMTGGKSMKANLALLLNNARLAAQIARAWRTSEKRKAA